MDNVARTGPAMATKMACVAALGAGDIRYGYNLGSFECEKVDECSKGNHETSFRHWKISAGGGSQVSLNEFKRVYKRVYNANGEEPG